MTPIERFLAKVQVGDTPDDCWLWTGTMHPWGYGSFASGRRSAAGNHIPDKAHRFAYEHYRGPIPPGLYIDHLCNNRRCVNPAHLEAVTNAENLARGYRRRMPLACRNGHPWTPENTARRGKAGRSCRRCHADEQNARYHAARMAVTDGVPTDD